MTNQPTAEERAAAIRVCGIYDEKLSEPSIPLDGETIKRVTQAIQSAERPLRERIKKLEWLAAKYPRHLSDCRWYNKPLGYYRCSCGLDEARQALKPKSEGEKG